MAFVVRERDGDLHRIVLPYAAWYYYLMWPTLIATGLAAALDRGAAYALAALLWVVMLSIAAPMWPVIGEVKRRMLSGGISARGSKWSLASPLTYEWRESDGATLGDVVSSTVSEQKPIRRRSPLMPVVLGIAGFVAVMAVAKHLGGAAGRSEAASDLEVGFRAVDRIRNHIEEVLRQAQAREPYSNPEKWAGSLPSQDVQFRRYSADQIRDYGYRQVHKMQLGNERGLTGNDPYREMAFILGNWDRTHD